MTNKTSGFKMSDRGRPFLKNTSHSVNESTRELKGDLAGFRESLRNKKDRIEIALAKSIKPCCKSCGDHGPCEDETPVPNITLKEEIENEVSVPVAPKKALSDKEMMFFN